MRRCTEWLTGRAIRETRGRGAALPYHAGRCAGRCTACQTRLTRRLCAGPTRSLQLCATAFRDQKQCRQDVEQIGGATRGGDREIRVAVKARQVAHKLAKPRIAM